MFLNSKLEELKVVNERYEKLSIEHASVTNSSSSVTQLEKENIELKTKLDELSSKYNDIQANYVHLKCSHEKLVELHIMLEVAHEVVVTSVKSSQPLSLSHTVVHHLN
jgi:DNA repair exonuclease SbcCD ATPase subunit